MSDISNSTWTELDSGNVSSPPNGLPAGTDANKLYPVVHAIMGAIKRDYVQENPVYSSTGTAASEVYIVNFEVAPEIGVGKPIAFNPNFTCIAGSHQLNLNGNLYNIKREDGADLQAGDIALGIPVKLNWNGTNFLLQSPRNVLAGRLSGTIDDARLPVTQAGKTFSSAVTISAGGANITGNTSVTGNTTLTGDAAVSGSLTQGGNRVVTIADYGTGKGIDADKLDGQEGTWYRDRANHTGTQPTSTISGLDTLLATKVSKAGDTMSGNLVLGTGAKSITLNATTGSISVADTVNIQATDNNPAILEMRAPVSGTAIDFSPAGYGGDFNWRVVAQPDNVSFDILHNGTHRFRFRNDGFFWTSALGWINERFADRGAQVVHNSGIVEFGSVDPNYADRSADCPSPWVLCGLRAARGTWQVWTRAVWLRNN